VGQDLGQLVDKAVVERQVAAATLAVLRGQARLQLPTQQVDLPVDQPPLVGELLLLLALA
jgi:hypothetical protein